MLTDVAHAFLDYWTASDVITRLNDSNDDELYDLLAEDYKFRNLVTDKCDRDPPSITPFPNTNFANSTWTPAEKAKMDRHRVDRTKDTPALTGGNPNSVHFDETAAPLQRHSPLPPI